jgi:GntR family transcriptional regulator
MSNSGVDPALPHDDNGTAASSAEHRPSSASSPGPSQGDLAGDLIRPPDRGDPLPLWAQVLEDLRRRLASGAFSGRFPTDEELVDQYRVSRHTVREAVRRLHADGLVERQRGRGSRVREPEFEQPMGSLYSLFRAIEDQGVEQTSVTQVLELRLEPSAALQLELEPHVLLVYLQRLRRAGGQPLALDRAWLPADLAGPLLDADFRRTGLYDELRARCGLRPGWARERIRPVVPGMAERRALGLGASEAAFSVERLTRATTGRLLEWRQSLVRGDRYAFAAEWSVEGSRRAGLSSRLA